MTTIAVTMSGDEIVATAKQHTLFEWSAQAHIDPIPVARARGLCISGRPKDNDIWISIVS